VIIISSAVIWDIVDNNLAVCHLDTGARLEMNGTASLIWKELQDIDQLASLIERVGEIYPQVSAPQLRRDVEGFVAKLLSDGFLESVAD
jgi:hypothetical protein